jgi:hypothetical protein
MTPMTRIVADCRLSAPVFIRAIGEICNKNDLSGSTEFALRTSQSGRTVFLV